VVWTLPNLHKKTFLFYSTDTLFGEVPQLAGAIGSSQSRIAKLEGADPGISLDLMIKALLRLGTSKKQIGKLLKGELEPA
jgi:hypothetical protein